MHRKVLIVTLAVFAKVLPCSIWYEHIYRTHLNVVSILCVHIAEQCQLTFRESSDFYMSYIVKWSM